MPSPLKSHSHMTIVPSSVAVPLNETVSGALPDAGEAVAVTVGEPGGAGRITVVLVRASAVLPSLSVARQTELRTARSSNK